MSWVSLPNPSVKDQSFTLAKYGLKSNLVEEDERRSYLAGLEHKEGLYSGGAGMATAVVLII